jgi:hypothetical protein
MRENDRKEHIVEGAGDRVGGVGRLERGRGRERERESGRERKRKRGAAGKVGLRYLGLGCFLLYLFLDFGSISFKLF